MFAISVCEEVKYTHKKYGVMSIVPLVVEFSKLLDGNNLQANTSFAANTPTTHELLHSVACLYSSHINNVCLESIYRRLCRPHSKTLLLLRDGEEIYKEMIEKKDSESKNCIVEEKVKKVIKKSFSTSECGTLTDIEISPDAMTRSSTLSSEEISVTENSKKTPSSGFASDEHENDCEFGSPSGSQTSCSRSKNMKLQTYSRPLGKYSKIEERINGLFLDSCDEEESEDELNDEHQELDSCYVDALIRGMNQYLDSVADRQEKITESLNDQTLTSSQISIEHRIIAAITYIKDYSIPSTRLINIELLAVKKSYQNSKLGHYLIQRLKCPSVVGPYNIMTVSGSLESIDFFHKNGFIDDPLLRRKFTKALNIKKSMSSSSLLFYLPPYYGNYATEFGSRFDQTNSTLSLKSMLYEIKRWRDKSLENYEEEVCMILRLKKEICRLHSMLGKQEKTINLLTKENRTLQTLLAETNTLKVLSAIDDMDAILTNFKDLCKFSK